METFEKILLRLKSHLGIAQDKDIAALLGMTVKAFTARKMRNSFPTDKLYALAAQKPELNLDTFFILTGTKPVENWPVDSKALLKAALDTYPDTNDPKFEQLEGIFAEQAGIQERRKAQMNEIAKMLHTCSDEYFDLAFNVIKNINETSRKAAVK